MTTLELEVLPRWDLSNVYPDLESDKFRKAVSDLNRQVDQLDSYLDENHISRTTTDQPRGPDKPA